MAKSKKENDDKGKKKKKSDIEIAFDNLKGFCQIGAKVSSPGNIPTGHFKLDFAIQYGMDVTKADLSKVEKNGKQYEKSTGSNYRSLRIQRGRVSQDSTESSPGNARSCDWIFHCGSAAR